MTVQHPRPRTPGIAVAVVVLTLLAGIVAMHSTVFAAAPTAHAAHSTHSPTAAETAHSAQAPAPVSAHAATRDAAPECDSGGCAAHAAMHFCVFVLAALAITLTLVLLFRLGESADHIRSTSTLWRGESERAPPWTVLTLSQLVILRI